MKIEDLIDELEMLSEEVNNQHEKEYLEELRTTLESECWRSSIVMGWGLLMHKLYYKISEYGLNSFAKDAKNKNMLEGQLNNPYDLNKMKDHDVIVLSREAGILPYQLASELEIQKRRRDNSAHIGRQIPTENQVLDFYGQVIQAISKIDETEFEFKETETLKKIKNISEEKVEDFPIEGRKSINMVKQIEEELLLVQTKKDFEQYKNYYIYLKNIVSNSKDEEVLEETLNVILNLIESRNTIYYRKMLEDIGEIAFKRSKFKKMVMSNSDIKYVLISAFGDSGSFRTAESRMEWLLSISDELNDEDWRTIAEAATQNNQIYLAHRCKRKLPNKFRANKSEISEGLLGELEQVDLI